MNKKHIAKAVEALNNNTLMSKLLLECWNKENPHFNNEMPHRYNGTDKECCYCYRPKEWKPVNPGIANYEIVGVLESVKP